MKKYLSHLFLLTILLGFAVAGNDAFSQSDPYGLEGTATAAGLKTSGTLPTVIGNVIGTSLSMVGVLFFGLMIYGGILWMTDRGNEEQSKKALETIKAAVIGMVIVLASYALTSFVFKSVGQVGGGGGGSSPQSGLSPQNGGAADACSSRGAEYECQNRVGCKADTIQTGLCPGGSEIVCCIADVVGPPERQAVCGNGIQEAGEQCDAGNPPSDPECSNDCKQMGCFDRPTGACTSFLPGDCTDGVRAEVCALQNGKCIWRGQCESQDFDACGNTTIEKVGRHTNSEVCEWRAVNP